MSVSRSLRLPPTCSSWRYMGPHRSPSSTIRAAPAHSRACADCPRARTALAPRWFLGACDQQRAPAAIPPRWRRTQWWSTYVLLGCVVQPTPSSTRIERCHHIPTNIVLLSSRTKVVRWSTGDSRPTGQMEWFPRITGQKEHKNIK
jgi:hypothetical protein